MDRDTQENVMLPEEVAKWWRVDLSAILRLIETGRLPAFPIGSDYRIRETDVLAFMEGRAPSVPNDPSAGKKIHLDVDDKTLKLFLKIDPFKHTWPAVKDTEPFVEEYDEAFEVEIPVEKRTRSWNMVIGFCHRESAGRLRRRAVVFWGDPSSSTTLYPVVQFTGGNDYGTNQEMASTIRDRHGKKQIRDMGLLPKEYAQSGLRIGGYRDVVDGPYASRGLAVIATRDDLASMAVHAWLRTMQKGWL